MTEPLLEAAGLVRHYHIRRGGRLFGSPAILRAVDGVSFTLQPGRTLGLVGESGCGKTTTARLVLGLLPLTAGEIRLQGETLPPAGERRWRELRRVMQMVYQDPLAALDQAVGLQAHHFDRYPHELSGGQRQRIVLARALILSPRLLVCDEPISALDVSIQAQVVNLLLDLQAQMGLAYLFISHDLRMVRQVSHEVAVMYLGRIVERGDPDRLFAAPAHPYTRALVSAIPVATRTGRKRLILKGDPPNPVDVPKGCAFHERCPIAIARCRLETPALRAMADGRQVACHLAAA